MNLKEKLSHYNPGQRSSPWKAYEHYKGYGVMISPFSSGHKLGLRVFPENDFAPYQSVWHCSPEGKWSIYNDGPSLETTCPRWWGNALSTAQLTKIDIEWIGPNQVEVHQEKPELDWKLSLHEPPVLRMANPVTSSLPLSVWKNTWFIKLQEFLAKQFLELGSIQLSFTTPNGQNAVIFPYEIYFIEHSEAYLNGMDLGHPIQLAQNPVIGDVALPRRSLFIIGEAFARIN